MLYLVLLVIILAAGAGAVAAPETRRVEVIPEPREVVFQGQSFAIQNAMEIRVSDTKPNLFAADLLIKALRELGVTPSLTLLPSSSTHTLTITASELLPAIPPSVLPQQAAEGYNLLVEAQGINLTARSEAGLFYGVQTIIQLVKQASRERDAIPGMAIRDWPEFEFRSASYIEGSQAKNSVLVSKAELELTNPTACHVQNEPPGGGDLQPGAAVLITRLCQLQHALPCRLEGIGGNRPALSRDHRAQHDVVWSDVGHHLELR